jgi:acyl-CoA synthetase (AMP-forming)/AMP-acid ligase II
VVAASDEVLGQRPIAYVIPATDPAGPDLTGPDLAGPNLTGPDLAGLDLADALRAACEAELPGPKVPTEFCLVPELPLGATGKVSRRRLRDMAMAAG